MSLIFIRSATCKVGGIFERIRKKNEKKTSSGPVGEYKGAKRIEQNISKVLNSLCTPVAKVLASRV